MRIFELAAELSPAAAKTVEHFRYYFDRKRCFALLRGQVVIELPDGLRGQAALEQEARERMERLLQSPPDFSTYVMDDSFGLVIMDYGVMGISEEVLPEQDIADGEMNLGTALAVRSRCLAACAAGEIVAIVDEEV